MLRVLLIEDEPVIGLMAASMLMEMGNWVIGPISCLSSALPAAQRLAIDCAVLDVCIRSEPVYPVAQILVQRRIPFIFATAYGPIAARGPFADRPVIVKPYQLKDLRGAIEAAMAANRQRVDAQMGCAEG